MFDPHNGWRTPSHDSKAQASPRSAICTALHVYKSVFLLNSQAAAIVMWNPVCFITGNIWVHKMDCLVIFFFQLVIFRSYI